MKKIKIKNFKLFYKILIICILIVVISLCVLLGKHIYNKNTMDSDTITYNQKYYDLKNRSTADKIKVYESKLNASTGPKEIKYLLDEILPKSNTEESDKIISEYLNHVQYFMSTYNSLISVYSSIILNERSNIDFTKASAINKINDNVLKSLVKEIYDNNMYISMPSVGSNTPPVVLTDYTSISNTYKKYMSNTTKKYIDLKVTAQSGNLANSDGSANKDKLESYIVSTNDFIVQYPKYTLINDIIYSYIVASEMYCNIYNVSNDFSVNSTDLTRYENFVKKYPSTPLTSILNSIITKTKQNTKITISDANNYITSLQSLMNTSNGSEETNPTSGDSGPILKNETSSPK